MIKNVDHIIIAVEDLESAEDNYTKIFGIEPVWRGFHNELGTSNVLFNFENTYLFRKLFDIIFNISKIFVRSTHF